MTVLRRRAKLQKQQKGERDKGREGDECIERYGEATVPCYERWEQA